MTLPAWENWPSHLQQSSVAIVSTLQKLGPAYIENIGKKYVVACGIDKSVAIGAPTFHDVTREYGKKATLFWLRLQLYKTFEFVGIADTVSVLQIKEVSNIIISHEVYGQLTLSEFLCFLQRFKEGRYEKLYSTNHPNMQEFMKCLPMFWAELINARGKFENYKRRQQEELDRGRRDVMTKEEWEEIKMLTKMYEMQVTHKM